MKNGLKIILGLLLIIAINGLSSWLFIRWDLTEDKRFTLSEIAEDAVSNFENPVIIDVLLEGDLPPEFSKLRSETELLLEQFASLNPQIKYSFVDPMDGAENPEQTLADLQSLGLKPANITTEEEGRVSQELVFPWAMVNYGTRTEKVPLLRNRLGADLNSRINQSVQDLEYGFTNAFYTLSQASKKQVAILRGNDELEDIYLADILSTLKSYYNLGVITLDSVESSASQTLQALKQFDAVFVAKPTTPFTDAEKYVLDQYIVQGGKSLWMIDGVAMEMDSLYNPSGQSVALPRDLNLNDFFFRYGVRINPSLVDDIYCTALVIATGEAREATYNPLPWVYYPMVISRNNHPINTNLEALQMQFASPLDTLSNSYKKTILYWSSPLSKAVGTPTIVSLDKIGQEPDQESYQEGNYPLAVLVEGAFTSAYTNRVKPVNLDESLEKGPENKMIVIGDGDLARNQISNGRPLELGFDKWTNRFYGNKDFLVNAMNYLLEDNGLINIRSKQVRIPLTDPQKINEAKFKWQLVNIGVPVLFILILGLGIGAYRRQKFKS